MDSDSPAIERTAAEQPIHAGSRFFFLGGTFGTFPEFGSPPLSETGSQWTRLVVAGNAPTPASVATVAAGSAASAATAPRHRRHREPPGHGPAS